MTHPDLRRRSTGTAAGSDAAFYEVSCKQLHPRGCQASIRGGSVEELIAAAIEHGARGHGYTPGFYDGERRAAMSSLLLAVTGAPRRSAGERVGARGPARPDVHAARGTAVAA